MTRHTSTPFLALGTFAMILACATLLGLESEAVARSVRLAGPQTLQLVDEPGQPQLSWTVESIILDVLQIGDTLFVACGPRGVLIYALASPPSSPPASPRLVGRIAEGRNVIKLAANGESLLLVAADYSTLSFSLADPQKPTPTRLPGQSWSGAASAVAAGLPPGSSPYAAPPAAVPRSEWAQVITVHGGWVTVRLHGAGSTQVGDRFIIRSQRRVRVSDPTGTRSLFAPSNQAMGMFVASHVEGDVASGPLPRGTIAHVGDLAEPTLAPLSAPLVGPQLWYGMGRFYGTLRPILSIASPKSGDNGGFGMLNDFTLEYYFRVPLKLGVQLGPQGLIVSNRTGLTTELRALLSFASSYFELGLEPGGELHLVGPSRMVLGYMLRIGSLDGLNLIFRNSYVLDFSSGRVEVPLAIVNGEINIPVAQRFNLYFVGGASGSYGYGMTGLKYYLRGGGGPGSLIVQGSVGGAWINDRCLYNPDSTNTLQCQNGSVDGVGPALGLGIDARF